MSDWDLEQKAMAESCPYEVRRAAICWAVRRIVENALTNGSFRDLLIELKLGDDAYFPLYEAGGCWINNSLGPDCDMTGMPTKLSPG